MIETTYYDLKQKTGLSSSMASEVARQLGRKIVSKSYHPGSLIEDEAALAQQYKVSRSVVRDAVKMLVGKGLLEVRRGIGTRVKPRQMWGLFDDDVLAWSQAAPPDPVSLRKLLEIRQVFEPWAARWAAERGSPDNLAEIQQAMISMESNEGSVDGFVKADAHFHRVILKATDNEFFIALEGLVFAGLLSILKVANERPSGNAASVRLHQAVCEAIQARDGALAEAKMRTLLEETDLRLATRLASMDNENSRDFDSGHSGNGRVGSKS